MTPFGVAAGETGHLQPCRAANHTTAMAATTTTPANTDLFLNFADTKSARAFADKKVSVECVPAGSGVVVIGFFFVRIVVVYRLWAS